MKKTSILESANFSTTNKYRQSNVEIGDIFYKNLDNNKKKIYLVIDYDYEIVYVIDVGSNNKTFRKVKWFTYKELELKGFKLEIK